MNVEVREEGRPAHPWNGREDGHNCDDCPPESIWRCDRMAHFVGSGDVLSRSERDDVRTRLRDDSRERRATAVPDISLGDSA